MVMESGTTEGPLACVALIALLMWLLELEDDDDAFECTKEQRPDSLLELLLDVLAEPLLLLVEDRFTSSPFPMTISSPLVSVLTFELLRLSLSTPSWPGIRCTRGLPIFTIDMATTISKLFDNELLHSAVSRKIKRR